MQVLPIDDDPSEDISSFFDIAHNYILKHKNRKENVLVHCISGISRGPSIVISYLIKYHNKKFQEAFEFTKAKRSIVSPNSGFKKQLKAYSKLLHGD